MVKDEDEGDKSNSSVVTASDIESARDHPSVTKDASSHSVSEVVEASAQQTSSQGSISEAISNSGQRSFSGAKASISEDILSKGSRSSTSTYKSVSEASSLTKKSAVTSSIKTVTNDQSIGEDVSQASVTEEDIMEASQVSSLSKDLKKLKYMAGKK